MIEYDELLVHLRRRGLGNGSALGPHSGLYDDAATAIETLRAELARVTAERDAAEKEITRLKAIMREKGIFTIPAKYPWEKPEWNW